MKRIAVICFALLALGLMLPACGGGDTSPEEAGKTNRRPVSDTPKPAPGSGGTMDSQAGDPDAAPESE